MGRPVKRIQADTGTVKELQRRARAATSTVREQERANIVLLRLDGNGVEAVAELLGRAGFEYEPRDFKRVASARGLYHWNSEHHQEY